MSRILRTLLALSVVCVVSQAPPPAAAQGPEYPTPEEIEAAETAPLFTSHEIVEITLTADFHTMREDDRSDEDSEERPARLEWVDSDGSTGTQEIQIQTRGNFRLSARNCDFPPLRLNVKTGDAEGTLLHGQDKIKVVSPCKLGQDYWQQYVFSEYLIYRMYNLLSPLSFRARLARVTYVDESGEDDPFTRYAFLLEDDSELAKRNGCIKQDWQGGQLNPVLLDKSQAILVEFFQYMIGNTDFSTYEFHNVVPARADPPEGSVMPMFYPVPYDFDWSGLVDAPYAEPNELLNIRDVKERIYRGFCWPDMNYSALYAHFQDNREAIMAIWDDLPGVTEDTAKRARQYLEGFYNTIENEGRRRGNIEAQCRNW